MTAPKGQAGPTISEKALRACFGKFATGVTVITARSPDGAPLGITMNSFSSVSLKPPLILFCLGRESSDFEDFLVATSFAVNILGREQQELSVRFANALANPWDGVPWSEGKNGAPLLRERIAALECRSHAQYDGGDHVIFVVRVEHLHGGNGAAPLIYWGSQYRGLDSA